MPELVLEIVEGAGSGRQIPLMSGIELGRDPRLPGSLEDEQVSRRHVRVTPSGEGATIEDLGSTNGTYVDEQPVRGAARLDPGDRFRVGLTVIELRTRTQVAAQPSAVRAGPPVTQLGADVLRPADERELAPVPEQVPDPPSVLVEAGEPGFVRESAVRAAVGDPVSPPDRSTSPPPDDQAALGRLADGRVKRQTGIAAFAILAIAGLALLILFGAR